MKILTFETHSCGGCRTCELACSYHHGEIFRPTISSIEILGKPDQQGFSVSFYLEAGDGHFACDGCRGTKEPLCIKYCCLANKELKTFLVEVS